MARGRYEECQIREKNADNGKRVVGDQRWEWMNTKRERKPMDVPIVWLWCARMTSWAIIIS